VTTLESPPRTGNGLFSSVRRPDGVPKVRGEFAFSSDLEAEGMLWGHLLRSPHPSAAIIGLDLAPALQMPGVRAVITDEHVPGSKTYGLDEPDQPVFASDVVRYVGEPIAAVAADHPETARRAAAAIVVTYDVREPVVDPEAAAHGRSGASSRQRTAATADPPG